jgi:hypothetical protein
VAGGVRVGDDDDLADRRIGELPGVLAPEAPGAALSRRRGQTERPQPLDVLLPLDPEDALVLHEVREPVAHSPHVAEAPDRAAPPVRPPGPEVLRLEPANLVEERAELVAVLVPSHETARGSTRAAAPGGEERRDLEPERVRDAVDRTAGEALEQDAAVPLRDRQAALLPVLVGGAECAPAGAGALDAAQLGEDGG